MKSYKLISLFIIIIMALVGCGGQQTAPEKAAPAEQGETGAAETLSSDIPVYPDAKEYEKGSNTMIDTIANPMIQQFESQYGADAELKFYSTPQGTTAQDIQNFYNEKMSGMGWKAEETPQSASGVTSMVWTKDDNTAFVLNFIEMPQIEPMLITVVAKKS